MNRGLQTKLWVGGQCSGMTPERRDSCSAVGADTQGCVSATGPRGRRLGRAQREHARLGQCSRRRGRVGEAPQPAQDRAHAPRRRPPRRVRQASACARCAWSQAPLEQRFARPRPPMVRHLETAPGHATPARTPLVRLRAPTPGSPSAPSSHCGSPRSASGRAAQLARRKNPCSSLKGPKAHDSFIASPSRTSTTRPRTRSVAGRGSTCSNRASSSSRKATS